FFRKIVRGAAPQCDEPIWIIGLAQVGLQLCENIVVKAKVRIRKRLFQNRTPGKKRQGRALSLIRRHQQHLAVSLVKRAGDMSVDRFGESDGAIVERDVQLSAIERSFSNFINLRFIQFYRAETQV